MAGRQVPEAEGLGVQLVSAGVINLVALLQGASVSSSSVVLHSLQEELGCFNSSSSPLLLFDLNLGLGFDFSVNAEDGSWVASTWVLSHLIFAPLAGLLNDRIGRKRSLMIDTTLFGLGFTILTAATSLPWLLLARLLLGAPLISQVYVCEVVSPSRRGLAAALYSVLHSLGFCLMLLLGALVHWRLAMAAPALLSLPTMAAVHCLRESPAWLQRRGRKAEARAAAAFYKLPLLEEGPEPQSVGRTDDPNKLRNPLERVKALLYTFAQQGSSFWHNFAFLAVLFCLLGWCGFSILSFYAVEVFQLSGSPLSAAHTSWITSLTKIVCAVASFYFLHKFSRRAVLLATASTICLSFLALGLFTHLASSGALSPATAASLNFVPMVMVILAYTGYGLGFGVVPSLLAAESTPVTVRSTVVGVLMAIEMSSTFLLSKLKPVLIHRLGIHGLFTLFAGIVGLVILLTHLSADARWHRPHTKNPTIL